MGTSLAAFLTHQRISEQSPVIFAVHLACPRLAFTDKGKTKLVLPQAAATRLFESVENVTALWAKTIKAEERNAAAKARRDERFSRRRIVKIKDAAWEVMEQAYLAVSDNEALPANARQIMYAARPHIQERTGKQLDDKYFTQTLLPDYVTEHNVDWDVVYDDRGHFREPHTGLIFGLGTLAVRSYLDSIGEPKLEPGSFAPPRITTRGPRACFKAAMFVEKEGFDALWQSVSLDERYDLAVLSTKGMSVTRRVQSDPCWQLLSR
jgi:hypothetical protein